MDATVLLFAGSTYYPEGGWDDFVGEFGSVEEALAAVADALVDWAHVVDRDAGRVVDRFYRRTSYSQSGRSVGPWIREKCCEEGA